MKRIILLGMVFLIFTSSMCLNAQWAKTYGGNGRAVQQTNDGGYIVAGSTPYDDGDGDYIWIIKLDSNGEIEWQSAYELRNFDNAYSIQQTTDGGYIVAGTTEEGGGDDVDMCVLKLDSNGVDEWCYRYSRSFLDIFKAYSIQQTSDGGYIAAGRYNSLGVGGKDSLILKFTSDGGIEWQKTYDRSGWDEAHSIQQTTDGGYIVAGSEILKLYSNGDIEWQGTYGGSFNSIQQTTDGGYIVAGSTSFGAGEKDFLVLKLDNNGDIEWQYAYGGDDWDIAYSIQQTSDEGYIVAGYTQSFETRLSDFFVLKLYFNGDIEWQRTYGGNSFDEAYSIQQTTDGGYIVTGMTRSYDDGFWVLKLDSNGNIHSSCEFIKIPDVIVTHTSIIPEDTDIIPQDADLTSISSWSRYNEIDVTVTHLCPIANDKDNDKKKICFIATAAYDSPLHPHIKTLQDFRDKYLMPSKLGRLLVNLYYKYSPFIAELITKHKVLKFAVRINLLPLVAFSYSMVHFGPIITSVILVFIFMLPLFLISFWRKRITKRLKNYDS